MGSVIAVLSFLGLSLFLLLAVISLFKKNGKGKKMFKFAAGCFVLMIIGVAISPEAKEETASSKVEENDKKQDSEKQIAAEESKKKEDTEATVKKIVEEEAAAKAKAEEEAKKKAEQETPEYKLNQGITKALGKKSNRDGEKLTELTFDQATGDILVKFKGDDNLTSNMIVTGVRMDIKDTLEAVKKSGVTFNNVHVIVSYSMVDQYGNAEENDVVDLIYSKATVDKINFENFLTDNVYTVADIVGFIHPEFNGK